MRLLRRLLERIFMWPRSFTEEDFRPLYQVQVNRSYCIDPKDWEPIQGRWSNRQTFLSSDNATKAFYEVIDQPTCDNHVRIVDERNNVCLYFDPERRKQVVRDHAFFLWMEAGQPISDGREFWFQAEKEAVDG